MTAAIQEGSVRSYVEIAKSALDNANLQIATLLAENARLRRALEPFADAFDSIPSGSDEELVDPYIYCGKLRVKHLRNARAALKGEGE